MRSVTSIKLLVGVAAFSWMGLFAGYGVEGNDRAGRSGFPTLQKVKLEAEALERGTLAVTKKDVDVVLSGRVRQDWLGYDKIYTLRASNDDQLGGFRTKASICLKATYGNQTYGKSAADAKLLLTNYGYWKRESSYTPFRDETTDSISNVRTFNLLTYVEEAWVNLHFGTFFKAYDDWFSLEKHPISLKIGYFPYQLGRGISFGDFPMHIPYLGWDSYGYHDTRYTHPGILIRGYVNKEISYDLYYSKQGENSISRSMTWKTIHANSTDGRRQWRGVAKERDLWAARLDLKHMKYWGDLHVQPYMMYIDAPELRLEFIGDSNARLGTVGAMVEYKKGRFAINAEVAGQFGHNNVFAIDRNQQETEALSTTGVQRTVHTHVFYGSNTETKAVVGTDTGTDVATVNSVTNRGGYDTTNKQWVPAVTKNGDEINNGAGYYNSNVTGNKRFRDGYRIDYRGFMGVVDMKYEFEKVPVTIASAGAYISGDKYPYNTEDNKRYKAFLPYGDYNYVGKYVNSQIILEARKLPRPVDISWHHQYAFNNIYDMSNLAFLGLSAKWKPFKKEKEKLQLQTNLLWFWETTTLPKWNGEAKLPGMVYDGESVWSSQQFEGDLSWYHTDGVWYIGCHKVGWQDPCKNASRRLGTELNFEAIYRPVPNCIFLMQLGCFIPGQLYKDLNGQPNERTINSPKAAEGVYGLGHDTVWRAALSLDYSF